MRSILPNLPRLIKFTYEPRQPLRNRCQSNRRGIVTGGLAMQVNSELLGKEHISTFFGRPQASAKSTGWPY